jgi:hypothetical protein
MHELDAVSLDSHLLFRFGGLFGGLTEEVPHLHLVQVRRRLRLDHHAQGLALALPAPAGAGNAKAKAKLDKSSCFMQ